MRGKLLFLIVPIIFLFLITFVEAREITTFNNSLSTENLSFSGNEDITRYLNIEKTANVTYAILNLTGIEIGLCYQETADVSTTCGGLSTGKYFCDGTWDSTYTCLLVYDGDWNTYGSAEQAFPPAKEAYLYINYTKPTASLDSSLWEVKDGVGRTNLTILENCWNQAPLQFKVYSLYASPYSGIWYCWDGTVWQELRNSAAGYQIYEEAMWWNLSSYPENVTLNIGNDSDVEFNHTETFDTQNQTSNSSEINDYLSTCSAVDGNCTIPFVFHSDSAGKIEYSAINITYFLELTKSITLDLSIIELKDRDVNLFREESESVSTKDYLTDRFKGYPRRISESLQITKFISKLPHYISLITQGININDFTERAVIWFREISESFNITDLVYKFKEVFKNISESIDISDFIKRMASFFRGILQKIGISKDTEKLADIITYSPRTYIQSIVPGSSLRFNITVRHSLNRTDDFDFTTTSFNFDYFNVTFQYNNLTIGQAEERKIEANITSLASTPVATYYGNITINRTRDSSKRNLTLTITVDSYAGNVEIYNATSLEKCGTGLCSWSISMQDTETESYKYLVKNTGNWNISLCNASIESASYSESWYSFSPTAFTLEPNNSTNLTLTFTKPPAGSYPSTKPQITCVATPGGGEDTLEPSNQDIILLAVSSVPVEAPTGGGPPPEVPAIPPELNLTLIPPQILQSFIPYKLLYQKNASYERFIRSNFEIESVELVNLENFTAEIIANSTILLSYNLFRGDYFSRQLGGVDSSVRVTDKFSRIAYTTPVSIVAINLSYRFLGIPIIIIIPLAIIGIIFAIIKRDIIIKKLKKQKKKIPFFYPY